VMILSTVVLKGGGYEILSFFSLRLPVLQEKYIVQALFPID
jgi:hypothetical protein